VHLVGFYLLLLSLMHGTMNLNFERNVFGNKKLLLLISSSLIVWAFPLIYHCILLVCIKWKFLESLHSTQVSHLSNLHFDLLHKYLALSIILHFIYFVYCNRFHPSTLLRKCNVHVTYHCSTFALTIVVVESWQCTIFGGEKKIMKIKCMF
jgi:hypothetical protein